MLRTNTSLLAIFLALTVAACGGTTVEPTAASSGGAALPPVPTVSLAANPAVVASGVSATLTWSSTDATFCTASGGWSGTRASSGGPSSTGPLTASVSYSLACTGPGGSASASATVNVSPTVSLTANPTSVVSGGSSMLTWSSTNATSCTASGGWSGAKGPPGGSESTGPLTASTTYSLICTGAGGITSASATVTVSGTPPPPLAPTVSLAVNPTSVASGGSSTLTWSSTNADTCTASGAWSGAKATSGSQSTGAVASAGTFSLSCTGTGGGAFQSATVTVAAVPTIT